MNEKQDDIRKQVLETLIRVSASELSPGEASDQLTTLLVQRTRKRVAEVRQKLTEEIEQLRAENARLKETLANAENATGNEDATDK